MPRNKSFYYKYSCWNFLPARLIRLELRDSSFWFHDSETQDFQHNPKCGWSIGYRASARKSETLNLTRLCEKTSSCPGTLHPRALHTESAKQWCWVGTDVLCKGTERGRRYLEKDEWVHAREDAQIEKKGNGKAKMAKAYFACLQQQKEQDFGKGE